MKKLFNLLAVAVLAISLVACSSPSKNTTEDASSAKYTAGTYEGVGSGNNGDVKVEVEVDENQIKSVTVVEHAETEGLADPALIDIPALIVEKQSTEVDVVSGATNTSNAIIDAVNAALAEASK